MNGFTTCPAMPLTQHVMYLPMSVNADTFLEILCRPHVVVTKLYTTTMSKTTFVIIVEQF